LKKEKIDQNDVNDILWQVIISDRSFQIS